jgi:hypothetical protein
MLGLPLTTPTVADRSHGFIKSDEVVGVRRRNVKPRSRLCHGRRRKHGFDSPLDARLCRRNLASDFRVVRFHVVVGVVKSLERHGLSHYGRPSFTRPNRNAVRKPPFWWPSGRSVSCKAIRADHEACALFAGQNAHEAFFSLSCEYLNSVEIGKMAEGDNDDFSALSISHIRFARNTCRTTVVLSGRKVRMPLPLQSRADNKLCGVLKSCCWGVDAKFDGLIFRKTDILESSSGESPNLRGCNDAKRNTEKSC